MFLCICNHLLAQELYNFPPRGTETRWISPENPTGEKGNGARTNRGAKGNAFYVIAPGEKRVIFDVKGAGVIQRMWMSGSIAVNPEQRRSVRIDIYWDDSKKPAVSAPIGDFFGHGLSAMHSFQSSLFGDPEGRSFNLTIPMPFKKAARIEILNQASSFVLYWFDINYQLLKKPLKNAMYFHGYWSRSLSTTLGRDFEVLPRVSGRGRYLGASFGVVGNPDYHGTWFGEGIVKIYLDGDQNYPTLVNTGTEDYVGSGWGLGVFAFEYEGSTLADFDNDLYSFYRLHVKDPVYFDKDCSVTLQQIGSATPIQFSEMVKNHAKLIPVWALDVGGQVNFTDMKEVAPIPFRILDAQDTITTPIDYSKFAAINFYRSDDVCAMAYFYLDKPYSSVPYLQDESLRLSGMKENVWEKVARKGKKD